VHHVAVDDDVLLALEAQLAGGLHGGLGLVLLDGLVGHDLGADEAALEVRVDLAGRAGRLGAAADGPGAHFLLAAGEVRDHVQHGVAGADERVQARLGQLEAGQEVRAVLLGELHDLGLDGGADDHHGHAALLTQRAHLRHQRVGVHLG
jgi:hypothetical protein